MNVTTTIVDRVNIRRASVDRTKFAGFALHTNGSDVRIELSGPLPPDFIGDYEKIEIPLAPHEVRALAWWLNEEVAKQPAI